MINVPTSDLVNEVVGVATARESTSTSSRSSVSRPLPAKKLALP